MFDTLSNSLQRVFRRLRGHGRLSESNVRDAMREVRMALLEADVNYRVARDFMARVQERCLGQEVLESITPGQQIIKRVHEEMVVLLGGCHADLDLGAGPAAVMLVGLHGSGKTTTAAKLAAHWKNKGKDVLLVAADTRRPAAVDQLAILASEVGAELLRPQPGETVPALGTRAMEQARAEARDVVLFDTGGRLHVDADLIGEIRELRETVRAKHVLLVADAAIGQESVNVATAFHQAVVLTGLILTKLDGDTRGGAALSIQAVTGCPIVFTGTGERLAALEPFHPERMASRILGMGDVVGLVEKVQQAVDVEKAAAAEKRLRAGEFNLEDFLDQIEQMKKLGPLENLLEMLPAGDNVLGRMKGAVGASGAGVTEFAQKAGAIIRSMTPQERRHPEIIDGSRRRRIARGSGTHVQDVNELLKQVEQARKMAKQLGQIERRVRLFR